MPHGDVEALQNKMACLLGDPSLRETMGTVAPTNSVWFLERWRYLRGMQGLVTVVRLRDFTAAPDVLRDIGHGKGPTKCLVAFGYAGWGPSQLDDEIARGDWYNVPEDPALVFDDDRANVWADAMARRKDH